LRIDNHESGVDELSCFGSCVEDQQRPISTLVEGFDQQVATVGTDYRVEPDDLIVRSRRPKAAQPSRF